MNTAATPTTRIDLRLARHDKDRLAKAAAIRGMPLSAFVRDAALREAAATVAEAETITLSAEESRRFLAALDAPFRPNKHLAEALALAAQVELR